MKRAPYVFAPGFSLLEVTIGAALILGVSVAMYATFVPASTAADVHGEVYRLDQLQRRVPGLFAAARDFGGIDTDPSLSELTGRSPWGTFRLSPIQVTTAPADGWAATYLQVPADPCGKLVLNEMGRGWHDVLVDGQAMTQSGKVLPACGAAVGHTVEFRAWGGLRSEDSPLTLPPDVLPPVVLPPSVPFPAPVAVTMPPAAPSPSTGLPSGLPIGVPASPSPAPRPCSAASHVNTCKRQQSPRDQRPDLHAMTSLHAQRPRL